MIIRGFKVEPVPVDAHAAVADVNPTTALPCIVPELAPSPRINSPGVVGKREIKHAVGFERSGFDGWHILGAAFDLSRKAPLQVEARDCGLIDLREWAEAAAGIVAVVRRPTSRDRINDGFWIEFLCHSCKGKHCGEHDAKQSPIASHFTVSKYARMSWMSWSEYLGSRSRCPCSGSIT